MWQQVAVAVVSAIAKEIIEERYKMKMCTCRIIHGKPCKLCRSGLVVW